MKKIILLFLVSCSVFVTAPSFAQDDCASIKSVPSGELNLQQVIELGLCRNPTTRSSYLASESARMNKNAGYSKYLPSVDASASAGKSYQNEQWGDWSKGVSVSASYLIFDFGKRFEDLNTLAATWRATGFDYSDSVQNYVYSIIAGYYSMLTANAEVKTANDLVKVAEEAKNTADKKFRAGAVAKSDVLKADTTLASKRLDLERSKGNREIAKAKLLSLLSFPQDNELKIRDMPAEFGGVTESENIQEMLDKAKKQRPDLLSAAENTNAAWHKRNSTFLQHLPSISASGNISYDATSLNAYNTGQDRVSGQIGIRATMPLFAGFAQVYSDRAATINYERAQEQERARTDSAELDVWTAFQNYKTARDVLSQTEILLKSAKESERVVAGMYKVGRSTMLDWQTAQADLADAQKQNIAAKYDLFVKRAALALAIGDIKAGLENKG